MTTDLLAARARARRTFAILALWIPLGVVAAVAIAQAAMIPALPDPIAVHWGTTGEPDGFGAPWTLPLLTLGVGGGLTALLAGIALVERPRATSRTSYRFLGAVVGAMTGFLAVLMLGLAIMQVGVDDAATVTGTGWLALMGLVAAAALGLTWFFVIDEPPRAAPEPAHVAPLGLEPGERAVWVRTASISRAGAITMGALLGGTNIFLIVLMAAQLRTRGSIEWPLWGTFALVLVVTILSTQMLRIRVRVDRNGLAVSSPVGWPRVRVPIDELTSAEVVHVSPMAEFGGWGWRHGAGGQGFVVRAGEGIRVSRTGRGDVTVTVDDAETAVALLRREMAAR